MKSMIKFEGGSLEDELYYTNLGFKAENSRKALVDLREQGIHRTMHLEYAQNIVANCKAVLEGNTLNERDAEKYARLMRGDLNELVNNPYGENVLKERANYIKKVDAILKKIVKMSPVSEKEMNDGIEFFEELIQKCVGAV